MPYALDGIKVIDVAINYAGPASSTYLGDQGAEVIKVERRIVGDTSRRGGNTPFLKLNSYAFMALNRGKRSITLDITKPEGQEILRDLAVKLKIPTRHVNNFTRRQRIGRATLARYMLRFEARARELGVVIDKEMLRLQAFVDEDVTWDEVLEVEELSPPDGPVYDLSVPVGG